MPDDIPTTVQQQAEIAKSLDFAFERPTWHYLISIGVSSKNDEFPATRPDGLTVANKIAASLEELNIEPIFATAYVSSYPVTPENVGLKDAWLHMTDLDKNELRQFYPSLVMAIELMCGKNISNNIYRKKG